MDEGKTIDVEFTEVTPPAEQPPIQMPEPISDEPEINLPPPEPISDEPEINLPQPEKY